MKENGRGWLNGGEIEGVLQFYKLPGLWGKCELRDENIGAVSVVGAGRNAGVPAPPDMDLRDHSNLQLLEVFTLHTQCTRNYYSICFQHE